MKKTVLYLCIALSVASCKSIKKHNQQIGTLHTVVDIYKDIDKVYKQLQKHHPKLYQYTPKEVLDFKFDSLKSNIESPISSRNFYKKLAPVVAHVKQGHVGISPPNRRFTKKERKILKKKKFQFSELDFEYLNDKLWVKDTQSKDSTIVGSEVVKMENEDVSDLIKEYKTMFSSDGYNQTFYNRRVGKRFTSFYYKDKGFLDSLKVTFKNNDSLFEKTFKRIGKKEKTTKKDSIKVVKLSKAKKKENRLIAKAKRKHNKKYGYIKSRKIYNRNFKFIGDDSRVAYMKIRGFGNGKFKEFYQESFEKIDSAKTQNLIIDLRDNGGGRLTEISNLYSYLTDKEFQFITESEVKSRIPFLKAYMSNAKPNGLKVVLGALSPAIVAHNLIKTKKKDGKLYYKFKQSKIEQPNPLNYSGKLYVLINGYSFSASSILSTQLQANNRATFVGEETGGAYNGTVAGIYKTYILPTSKIKIRMGLMQIEAPYKQQPDGYGVKPDVEILPTVKDRSLGIDLELDWILQDISSKKEKK